MNAVLFDTYKTIKTLKHAGAGEPMGKAIVATIKAVLAENMVTKAGLQNVAQGLNRRMDTMNECISGLEKTMIIHIGPIVYSAVGFAVAVFALWNKLF